MRTASAALKLGIFVTVTGLVTAVLALTIANVRFVDSVRYKAIFTDVTGLLKNDDVRASGVRVGQVEDIKLRGTQAEVTFSIGREGVFRAGLPRSVELHLRYRNLVGQRYIELTDTAPANAGEYLRPGETIPAERTHPALDLTVLFNGFRPLFKALEPQQVNTLAMQIVQTLQGEAGTVNSVLAHVASLTNTLADRDQVIGQVIDNLNTVLGTIDSRHEQVNKMVLDLRALVSGLAADREAIFDSVAAINQLTGTTTELLKDVRPGLKSDIAHLNKLADTLADHEKDLNLLFKRTPDRIERLMAASSYGSWFNFYLCGLDARIALPGGPVYQTPRLQNENARCK
ncbi:MULTISPECIES: MCE family protein [Thermomonospora]|uniref:Virulence factor Mce family protein n=1 Tax=Thermomonospora curvata (strain ATCC 19995 / DSM 43183 / JCM 3096 / KCTC 9072 / NBRC 15933 / NCIMB 10081 / Henssen B9) TaxID=471852 RepID=D1A3A2_THECD|nr:MULTISPECIES: MCE family protein [Thermomonospora]ACY99872.1 virulence factor Mce family protein [Thermomonospora curvata DSM 43183]PKK12875.1 MAG: MCE family protein [Thermomonospora sp. CIF 1]